MAVPLRSSGTSSAPSGTDHHPGGGARRGRGGGRQTSRRQLARPPPRPDQRQIARSLAAFGLLDQEVFPARLGLSEREVEPVAGSEGLAREVEAGLVRRAVFLLGVAPAAGGDDVLPDVEPPPRALGITWSRFSAPAPQYWHVHASRAKTARRVRGAWDRYGIAHVPAEPNDRRRLQHEALGMEHHPVRHDDLGLVLEDEHDRPPGGHHRQRRVGSVQDERTSHAPECSRSYHVTAGRRGESQACNLRTRRWGRPGRCLELRTGAARGVSDRAGPPSATPVSLSGTCRRSITSIPGARFAGTEDARQA